MSFQSIIANDKANVFLNDRSELSQPITITPIGGTAGSSIEAIIDETLQPAHEVKDEEGTHKNRTAVFWIDVSETCADTSAINYDGQSWKVLGEQGRTQMLKGILAHTIERSETRKIKTSRS